MRSNPHHRRPALPKLPTGIEHAFFRTQAGPEDAAYPESPATTYYGRRLKNVSFTEEVGNGTLSYQTTNEYGHLFNLSTQDYIEEGSIVLCFRINGRWFTIDKVKVGTVVAVGTVTGTSGTPTATHIRRLKTDGTELWAYELPHDSVDDLPVLPSRVAIDSKGNIYCAWMPLLSSSYTAGKPCGGIVSLTPSGELRWDIEFPPTTGFSSWVGLVGNPVAVGSDDSIWCGTVADADQILIRKFDSDGELLLTLNKEDLGISTSGSGIFDQAQSLTFDLDGSIWVTGHPTGTRKLDPADGAILNQWNSTGSPGSLTPYLGVALSVGGRWSWNPRSTLVAFNNNDPVFYRTNANEPTSITAAESDWVVRMSDFDTLLTDGHTFVPDDILYPFGFRLLEGARRIVRAGTNFIYGTRYRESFRYNVVGDSIADRRWNLFAVDYSAGTPAWIQSMQDPEATGEVPALDVFDLAHETDTFKPLYVASAGAAISGYDNVAAIDIATGAVIWKTYLGPESGNTDARCIATRTI